MNNSTLHKPFFTPIFTINIESNLADKVEDIITPKLDQLEYNDHENNSSDFYKKNKILNENEVPYLFDFINTNARLYAENTNMNASHMCNYWVQNYDTNQTHHQHTHPHCSISGVYFIRSNENAGNLRFENPNPYVKIVLWENVKKWNGISHYDITPKKGMLVLFPSYMTHQVLPSNSSDVIRTSLAFNYRDY